MKTAFRAAERKIIAWLTANGINPKQVPREAIATVKNGKITCPVYLHKNGKPHVDKHGKLARSTVTVDELVPASPTVAAWLRGEIRP